ncbi:UDP-N-acetylmuramoyl-tripeptide--D-alanyl-D-alanine ligase [Alphaproteobacteria bacterium]|nr:UDP-N-acetylmuramoyl-tripeptide--D-alanyl-D-alanine ligase [Alphaproteobacteria bacterium]
MIKLDRKEKEVPENEAPENETESREEKKDVLCSGWSFDKIIDALRFIAAPTEIPITGFAIDSRDVKPGEVFVAFKGARVDGHDFLEQAYQKGAALALVEHMDLPALKGRSFLKVDHTGKALMELAQYARENTRATVVCVAGSVGKTTVRAWITHLLSAVGPTVSAQKNFNSQIGLPLSLTALQRDATFGVFEIGIDKSGVMQSLATLCNPHVAVLTSIDKAHYAGFSSLDSLAQEKAMLFSGLCPNGIAVVNQESCEKFPFIQHIAKEYGAVDVVTVGYKAGATVRIVEAKEDFEKGTTTVTLDFAGKRLEYPLHLLGDHWVLDSALALAAAVCASFEENSLKDIVSKKEEDFRNIFLPQMPCLEALEGRGIIIPLCIKGRHITLIDDTYNANLASMKAGLNALLKQKATRHIAVVGDMMELGAISEAEHAELFELLRQSNVAKVYAVGEHVKAPWESLPPEKKGAFADSVQSLGLKLEDDLQDGDAIWSKASRVVGLSGLTEYFKSFQTTKEAITL